MALVARSLRTVISRSVKTAFKSKLDTNRSFQVCRYFSRSSAAFDRLYSDTHEWVDVTGKIGTVGISDHAQKELGDVVYIELPEVGAEFEQNESFGAVESVKAASDVHSPVSGTVTEINSTLEEEPARINKSCYDDGWIYKIEMSDPSELESLMNEEAYAKFTESTDE